MALSYSPVASGKLSTLDAVPAVPSDPPNEPSSPGSNLALLELRAKYAEMLAMRLAEPRTGAPRAATADPRRLRARMNDLAERFPGALREIDRLPLSTIEQRIAELDAVVGAGSEPSRWMVAVATFHALTRGVLVAKRWLRGRKVVDASFAVRFAQDLPRLPFPADGLAWKGELASVASPPRGRLLDLVFARLARELGTSEGAARHLVFGDRGNPADA